jgi:probable rRNA maturation factor
MLADPLVTFRRRPAALDTGAIEAFAEILRDRIAKGREFHCLITGDREMQALNARFRGKDEPTDVLSFPSGLSGRKDRAGDIAVSLARARAQAREFGHPIDMEIRVLMLHGVLHLMGMDHETDSGAMRRAETRWRTKLGLPGGLIERATS